MQSAPTSRFTGMLNAVANLVAFIGLLWVLSEKLLLPIGGQTQHIPGILVWVALLYSVAGTWLAAKIGNPLIGLNYHQERLQADFRFSLVRLRENSEAVAFYGGEAREHANFMDRFYAVLANYRRLILPQKPYLPLGSLHSDLLYPRTDLSTDDATIRHALTSVGMGDLSELLDEIQPWTHVLSLGEQQRLAMARVLLTRPRWLFMDKASSALDEPTEERLYRLIIENLTGITLVSVGHRSTLQAHHTRRLQLLDDGAWRSQSLIPNPPVSAAS